MTAEVEPHGERFYQPLLDADTRPVPPSLRATSTVRADDGDIARERYFDPAFHRLEVEHMWGRVWQMACREEQVPEVGDSLVYEIVDASLIVVRTAPDEIRAFHNSCLHRGTQLRTGSGNVSGFRCPFHGFTWNLDGSFREMPCPWDFPQVDPTDFGLPEAQVGTWGGFVFVNLDPAASSLTDYLEELPRHFAAWPLEERSITAHVVRLMPCNWKVGLEAFIEAYHTVAVHPQLLRTTGDTVTEYDIYGRHVSRMITPVGIKSEHVDREVDDTEILAAMFITADAQVTVDDGATARQVLADQMRTSLQERTGRDFSQISDAEALDGIEYFLFPNFMPWAGFLTPLVYRFRPNGNDPDSSIIDIMLLEPVPDGGPRPAPAATRYLGEGETFADAPELGFLGRVLNQDGATFGRIQRGLHASVKPTVTLAHYQEQRIRHFHATLDTYLTGRVLTESYCPADTSAAILDSTIAGILRDAAARDPGRVALVAGTADPAARARWTYAEVLAQAESVARSLADRFTPGERLAVLAPSTPESFVLSFAAAMARLVLVPMNPLLRAPEIAHVLGRSGAAGAFFVAEHHGRDLAGLLADVSHELPALRELVPFAGWATLLDTGVASGLDGAADLDGGRPLPPPLPDDVALLVFTSGTTGTPKGAMLTHRGMCNASRLGGLRFGLGTGDVYVNTIPLFHVGGQGVTFQIVQASATNVLVTQFDAQVHLELLEQEHATHTIGVPTMLLSVADHPDFTRRDLSRLRSVSTGGAAVPAELVRQLERALDVRSTIVFGQTEACGFISQTLLDDDPEDKAATVGPLLPQLDGRVIDADGEVVPVGEVGELQIRGFAVMAGYFDDPDATGAAIEPDGWLHTGDLATMDARGYLTITGRLKDMIVTGGINVFPVEIEAAIAEHPLVADVAVFGVPDDRWGEAVVAVVRASGDAEPDPTALETFTRDRLAPYKVPKRWVFVAELPRTASGKVQKFVLRESLLAASFPDEPS